MKLLNKSSLLLILFSVFFMGQTLHAQRTLVDVKIDSAAILIGEQTVLHLTLTTDKDKEVQLIIPRDTLMNGVEVIQVPAADTSVIENNRMLIKQDVLITSFDSSLYLLPPFTVIDGMDTIYSNQVALKVSTIPVNTDNPEEFYDIKDVWNPPFVLADYYPWIFGVLLALFIICVIGYIIQRLRNKKPLVPFQKSEPKLPPYEQAIKELDAIKQQKLWQQGLGKEYYTEITDTLRRYIHERFGITAMEMTSGEILDALCKDPDAKPVFGNLKQIMNLADFVKFAKMNPLPDENDLSMKNAYLFVENTKIEEEAVVDTEKISTDGNKEVNSEDSTEIKK